MGTRSKPEIASSLPATSRSWRQAWKLFTVAADWPSKATSQRAPWETRMLFCLLLATCLCIRPSHDAEAEQSEDGEQDVLCVMSMTLRKSSELPAVLKWQMGSSDIGMQKN